MREEKAKQGEILWLTIHAILLQSIKLMSEQISGRERNSGGRRGQARQRKR
jgi:hypothetical protein